ncbi:bifunctional 5,10-methylenetetrahydrofolate dehydrogenase/5,10-methenyltetrahydrofolate cyclohydrolase [Candidatus Dojkabacteria bacterium]|uniref:Bifunctional protein FolD n=1 Tax=Candidatus Dojkabacteria bacterium TaxID=2099670 RepID=A0A955LAR7_9BACT|nr:bifunctional 5,10-methylenetetrahydrofolate dehydrogenase/5,10-methenyltetrahydrofolate cyclohydrolase [Candidatus Dojkabacteria bacterium]
MANIIDGKIRADKILSDLKEDISNLQEVPRLAIFLASDDYESEVFVNLKMKKAHEIGMETKLYQFPLATSSEDLTRELRKLRSNVGVHGALLQLPMFDHLRDFRKQIVDAIPYDKDADGLTAYQQGKSCHLHEDSIPPATVEAVLECLDECFEQNLTWQNITSGNDELDILKSQNVVIVNNSNLIGKPLAAILSSLGATVTIANEFTNELGYFTSRADILITATGKTNIINHEMVKEGAIVIDVTSTKVNDQILGDVIQDEALLNKVSYITPVPGGVGPLTVACLLRNVIRLCS